MIEGHYGQHSATGKWFAEIYHPEFGPITQWGDDAAEATRRVEIYVRRHWDPAAQEYEWTPYEEALISGRMGAMVWESPEYEETRKALMEDPIIIQMAQEIPEGTPMTDEEGEPLYEFTRGALEEYQRRGGIHAKHIGGPAEAIIRIKKG